MLSNVFFALIVTFALSVLWLRLNDFAAGRGWVESRLSRKIIHIGTGPLFVLCWLLFPPSPWARYLAALVPLLITAQFFLVGVGAIQDEAAVQAMSRTGDRREILLGPLFYGIVFVVLTVAYWKDSPLGIVALMLLCGGDGLADVFGRRYGSRSLPWNPAKTWAGSLGMLLGSFLLASLVLGVYVLAGVFPGPFGAYLLPLALISLIATAVETLPLRDVDNLTVPAAALLAGYFLL